MIKKIGITSNNGQLKFDSGNYLNYIILDYEFNKYPRGVVDLFLNKTDWLDFNELSVALDLDTYKTEFPLAIDSISSLGNNEIQIQGYLCTLDKINIIDSKYLGKDSESSIRTLGFHQDLEINKISNDYFQLNETALKSLDTIMLSNPYQGIYTVSESKIKSIEISSLDSFQAKCLPRTPTRLQLDRQFNTKSVPNKGKYVVTSKSIGGSSNLSQYSQFGKNLIAPYLNDADLNFTSNFIYRNGLSVLMGDDLDDILNIEIGDIVNVPNKDLNKHNYVVTKLRKFISYDKARSSFEIQGEL